MNVLLMSLLLLSPTPQVEEISFTVSSVKKSDLPDDFPFQVLNEGFAVLKLKMENRSSEAWTFRPEEVEVFEGGGKKLDRAVPTSLIGLLSSERRSIRSPSATTPALPNSLIVWTARVLSELMSSRRMGMRIRAASDSPLIRFIFSSAPILHVSQYE